MTLWVDGDSCPRRIRDFLNLRIPKMGLTLHYIANRPLELPEGVEQTIVPKGPEEADRYLKEKVREGDLVITKDILLAKDLLAGRVGAVLDHRGELFTPQIIKERLLKRNLTVLLDRAGIAQNRSRNYSEQLFQRFKKRLEGELKRLLREENFRKV